jgi:integrase
LTYSKRFLSETAYAASTRRWMERTLAYTNRVFEDLRRAGLVSTANPAKLTAKDITAFVQWMNAEDAQRRRPLAPVGQTKLLQPLSIFLRYLGNPVMDTMKARGALRIPRGGSGPLTCPAEGDVRLTVQRLQQVAAAGDVHALGVLGHVVFAAFAGLRLKEVRLAARGDLRLGYFELDVKHPKGENRWAAKRVAIIVPPGRQAVQDFLDLRSREFERRGLPDDRDAPLVPFFGPRGVGPWNDGYLRSCKCELERELGLRFDFQMLRRAFGQNALDRGARLDSVSVALGHTNTRTTEAYYARMRTRDAFRDLERVWVTPSVQKPL